MARRKRKSPTLEEIENRIEPDLESAFAGSDLSSPEDFDLAWNEYFEGKDEILYSQHTKQRTFDVYNNKRDLTLKPVNPQPRKVYIVKRGGKEIKYYRAKNGRFEKKVKE